MLALVLVHSLRCLGLEVREAAYAMPFQAQGNMMRLHFGRLPCASAACRRFLGRAYGFLWFSLHHASFREVLLYYLATVLDRSCHFRVAGGRLIVQAMHVDWGYLLIVASIWCWHTCVLCLCCGVENPNANRGRVTGDETN